MTIATWRTSLGPSNAGTRFGTGVSAGPDEASGSKAGAAISMRPLDRASDMLRARGTAACVRASSPRAPRERLSRDDGGSSSPPRASRAASWPIVTSSVDASMSSPCFTIARPSVAASSRPLGKRSSRAAASACNVMTSSSGGTSCA